MIQIQNSVQKCIAKIIQHNPVIKNIFDEIYQQSGRILLVGGAVRDCFRDCFESDLDFEVYHLSLEHLEYILQQFGKVSFVGKSFGVLRLHGIDADWSIPRKDSYGRKPDVALDPHMSFDQAFKRRDLTINAMGIDVLSLELVDPFGGLRDLYDKILRAPDPEFFAQDPLRLFRVMQFTARLDMQADDKLDEICKNMDISGVASERIQDEFKKLFLKSDKPSLGLAWLLKIDRLKDILPEVIYDDSLARAVDCLALVKDIYKEKKLAGMWGFIAAKLSNVDYQNINYLEAVPHTTFLRIKEFLQKHVKSGDIIQDAALIAAYLYYIPLIVQAKDMQAVKWFAYWIGPHLNIDIFSEIASCWYDVETLSVFIKLAQSADVFLQAQEPLLTGKDLLEYGQGKELGVMLKKAYALQLNKNITQKKKLLELLLNKE